MKTLFSIIAVLIISTLTVGAQEMFVASGSVGRSGQASLCYVIGGIVVEEGAPITPVEIHSYIKRSTMTTEIEQLESKAQLNVYPNPASDYININLGNDFTGAASITIYDMASNIVGEDNLVSNNTRMNLSNLESGVYLVKVEGNMGAYSEVKRIIIN